MSPVSWTARAWGVLTLYLIPVGGGIPAGVLLAKHRGIGWPASSVLYFISDVILALVFEPLLKLFVLAGRRMPRFGRFLEAFRASMRRTGEKYGTAAGPVALILIAFGVDPMTGRSAAAAAGHGFVSGWALAIAGDMLYFWLIMVSTLSLNSVLGDGTWTTAIILAGMLLVPMAVKRLKSPRSPQRSPS